MDFTIYLKGGEAEKAQRAQTLKETRGEEKSGEKDIQEKNAENTINHSIKLCSVNICRALVQAGLYF